MLHLFHNYKPIDCVYASELGYKITYQCTKCSKIIDRYFYLVGY